MTGTTTENGATAIARALAERRTSLALEEGLDTLLLWLGNPDNPRAAPLERAIAAVDLDREQAAERAYDLLEPLLFEAPARAPLRTLGLPSTTDAASAKGRYRRLLIAYHPDRHPDLAERLTRRTEQINVAYARYRREAAASEPPDTPRTRTAPGTDAPAGSTQETTAPGGEHPPPRRGRAAGWHAWLGACFASPGCRRALGWSLGVLLLGWLLLPWPNHQGRDSLSDSHAPARPQSTVRPVITSASPLPAPATSPPAVEGPIRGPGAEAPDGGGHGGGPGGGAPTPLAEADSVPSMAQGPATRPRPPAEPTSPQGQPQRAAPPERSPPTESPADKAPPPEAAKHGGDPAAEPRAHRDRPPVDQVVPTPPSSDNAKPPRLPPPPPLALAGGPVEAPAPVPAPEPPTVSTPARPKVSPPGLNDCAIVLQILDRFAKAYTDGDLTRLLALYEPAAEENQARGWMEIGSLYAGLFATSSERRIRFTGIGARPLDAGTRCLGTAGFEASYRDAVRGPVALRGTLEIVIGRREDSRSGGWEGGWGGTARGPGVAENGWRIQQLRY